MSGNAPKPRLVILGGGFACFRLVKQLSAKDFEIFMVSSSNHFLFTPLLASTTVGTIEFRSIIEPLRQAQKDITFYQATSTSINQLKKTVTCRAISDRSEFELSYDILVIGVGVIPNTFGLPGVVEHALFLKDLDDARLLRQRLIETVERASLPDLSEAERNRMLQIVVVGGGPTGVEYAAELHDFARQDLKRYFPAQAEQLTITLVEAGHSLLGTFDAQLGAYASRIFARQKIHVRTDSPVRSVEESHVVLQDNSQIQFGLLIWSAGNAPSKLIQAATLPKDAHGRLITDQFLCVESQEAIYAIGDCATIRDQKLPATGQLAQQQGKYLGKTLTRKIRGQPIRPFRYIHLGMLTYVGSSRALADLPGIKWHGFVAWLLWRSIYLTKLVSLKNKTRVLFDWIKASIFGRDVTTF